jgi:uncharacterized iron-regulated protein
MAFVSSLFPAPAELGSLRHRAASALLLVAALGAAGCASAPPQDARSAASAAPPAAAPLGEQKEKEALPRDIVAKSALPIHGELGSERLSEGDLWQRVASARAICFGETHTNANHHYAELRALQALIQRAPAGRKLAVGFEMFQLPAQPAMDRYMRGEIDEDTFLTQAEYKTRWGFDFALYRPLLEAARDAKIGALALNASKELTRKIGRGGLASLDENEKKELPELDLKDPVHRGYFDAAMAEHPMPPGGPKADDMYTAQVVWDETMANTAAAWLKQAGSDAQLIVFAGVGHCHKTAIPARLTRRTGIPVLSIRPLLASAAAEESAERSRYDIDVVLEDGTQPAAALTPPAR